MPNRKTIILADDDIDDVFIFESALGKEGKLEVVRNGNELISLLDRLLPDLIFLDLYMPKKNGLECLDEIRKDERLQRIPVVVFSSNARLSNVQNAYERGAHLFLVKSFEFDELKSALKTIIDLDWTEPEKIKAQYYINDRYVVFN